VFQSIFAALALAEERVAVAPGFSFVFTAAIALVTGTMFLMWLGGADHERASATACR